MLKCLPIKEAVDTTYETVLNMVKRHNEKYKTNLQQNYSTKCLQSGGTRLKIANRSANF